MHDAAPGRSLQAGGRVATPAALDPGNRTWRAILVGFLACSLGATLYQTRTFYFFSDDFLNFVIASDMGLTSAYLARDVFGQFVPLYRLVNYAYLHCFGVVFWPFRLLLVLFHWIMTLAVFRLGAAKKVHGAGLLLALSLVTFSPVFASTQQWWSAALSVLVSAGAVSLALIIGLRRSRPFPGDRILIALLFTTGLAVYPKTLLTIIPLFSARLFARLEDRHETVRKSVLASLADLWPIVSVAIIYTLVVSVGGYSAAVKRPTLSLLAAFILRGWNRGFLSNVFGFAHATASLAVLNLLVLAMVGLSIARHPRTSILWAGFIVYFVASTGLIGWNRTIVFGLEVADISRYYVDTLCFFLIISIAGFGSNGASQGTPRNPTWPGALAAGVLSMLLVRAAGDVPHLWYAGPQKPAAFVTSVKAGLAQAGHATLANPMAVVPQTVMPAWMWPLTQYKYFLPILGYKPTDAAGGAAMQILDDGTVKLQNRS